MNLLGLDYFTFPVTKIKPYSSLYNIIITEKNLITAVQMYSRKTCGKKKFYSNASKAKSMLLVVT